MRRLQGISAAADADFETLDVAIIDEPVLRLDHAADRQRLLETVERHGSRLLVLDPLVRLHGVDENAFAEIAPILGFLRGSSELHAWGDGNLYLRRRDAKIVITVERRADPGLADLDIELADGASGTALRLRKRVPYGARPERPTPEQRVVQALADAGAPLNQVRIRQRVAARNATVGETLHKLVREGRVERASGSCCRLAGDAD